MGSRPPFFRGNGRYILREDFKVSEHLEDSLSMVGEDFLFECKIECSNDASCVWYKDGSVIRNQHRYSTSRNDEWFRLQIRCIEKSDQGVYCVICTKENLQVFTHAMLFVPAIIRFNRSSYFSTNPYDCTRIIRHLSPVIVTAGKKIKLLLKVETFIHITHQWFKDDVKIKENDRIIIENNDSIASLVIEEAKPSDAGIYALVMSTTEGVMSSYAAVHVVEDINMYAVAFPTITEHLKRNLDVVENKYVKLMCRGFYDIGTIIYWYMNDIRLDDSHVLLHDYGNGYFALKILNTLPELSGRYKVVLRNEETDKIDISVCNLTVQKSGLAMPRQSNIIEPLKSAVACCGATVVFDCTFSCENHHNLKVIWFVGRYKVERSNRLFSVICKGGTFILHIKKLTLEMAGEVICEIHQWQTAPKFVHVAQSTANLTLVPQGFLKENIGNRAPKIYKKGTHYKIRPLKMVPDQHQEVPGTSMDQPSTSRGFQGQRTQQYRPDLICKSKSFKFKFCKLDKDGQQYYFSWDPMDRLRMYYNHPTKLMLRRKRDVCVFQWTKRAYGAWYCISYQTEDGSFKEFGITDTPQLEVEGPRLESLLIFNIAPILPVSCVYRRLGCFRINTELEMSVPPQRRERVYAKFEEWYTKQEEIVGGGAFGKVALIEDDYGKTFAAKFIKVEARNCIDYALREFYTLRKLVNHNIVGVVDAYTGPDFVIIVMDYLWGGELLERVVCDKYINEADIPPIIKQICAGLAYIHSQNVVHLDLKPENLVFAHPNSLVVKLVDFGLSRVTYEGSRIQAVYGTREYVAPEVLRCEPIHLNTDMWSLGVVVYMMLAGALPFEGNTEAELTFKIISAQYHYEGPAFRTVSDLAQDFIDHILVVNPRRRFTVEDALKHPWIVHGPPKGSTTGDLKVTRSKLKLYIRTHKAKWQERARYFRYLWTH